MGTLYIELVGLKNLRTTFVWSEICNKAKKLGCVSEINFNENLKKIFHFEIIA